MVTRQMAMREPATVRVACALLTSGAAAVAASAEARGDEARALADAAEAATAADVAGLGLLGLAVQHGQARVCGAITVSTSCRSRW